MLEPSKASSALNKMFWACQPMVLKASVTPTAVPSASALAVFSASIRAALRALALRSPPALMSLSITVVRTSESTKLVAIKPLMAREAPAAGASSSAGSSLLASSSTAPSSAAVSSDAASSDAASSLASSSDSSCSDTASSGNSWSDSKAVILAEPRASSVTSPPASMAALSTKVLTTLRTSLRTSWAPKAALPSLPTEAPTRATMPEVSLALAVTSPPMVKTVSSGKRSSPVSVLGVSKTLACALTKLEASTKPTAAPPLDWTVFSIDAWICGTVIAVSVRFSPTSRVVLVISALDTAGWAWARPSAPIRASMPAEKMFCGCQPTLLKANTTPAATPLLLVLAVFSAWMVALFSASTAKLPPTVAWLSRRAARVSIKIRLVAIRPLAAMVVAPPSPSPSPSPSAAGSAPSSSVASLSTAAATTSPLKVASIWAEATASTEASPSVVRVKCQASADTSERTSLREKTPPAATAPPEPPSTLADMATSAVMLASSVADTVRPPPTFKVAWAAPSRRFLPSA